MLNIFTVLIEIAYMSAFIFIVNVLKYSVFICHQLIIRALVFVLHSKHNLLTRSQDVVNQYYLFGFNSEHKF